MCARKSKTKKFSHQDCVTCRDSSGSNASNMQRGPSNANLQKPDNIDCSPKIIVCPKVLKVADKDVEVGGRPSIHDTHVNRYERNRYDRMSRYEPGNKCQRSNESCEDQEDLRRKAFQLYKQYLEQKRGGGKFRPDFCPPPPPKETCNKGYYEEESCYDPSFNIFLVIVFMILFVMLAITTGFIFVVTKTDWLKDIFKVYAIHFIVPAIFVVFLMNCTMACSSCSRVLPCNFLYLLFAVVCMCIITSVLTVLLDTTIVLTVFGTTAVVTVFFIMLAYSHFDFTKWILYVIGIILALLGMWAIITAGKKYANFNYGPAQLFLAIVVTVIYIVILIIELQLLLSGRSIDIDESEYATGAYLLFTAVLELLFNIVQTTGVLDESDKEDINCDY